MKFWKKIATLGVTPEMPVYKQKSTILFNIVMRIIALLLVIGSGGLYFLRDMYYVPIGLILAIPVILTSLFLNFKGKVNLSVLIIAIFFPFYFIAMSIYAKVNGESLNVFFYVAPRFGIIILSVVAFAVVGFKNVWKGFVVISSGIAAFALFDIIHQYFGIYVKELPYYKNDVYFLISGIGGLFVFFIVITLFMQRINSQYEKLVTEQRDILSIKNAEIISQKEEIETQKDEIEAQRDNVLEQKDKIQKQNKQITDSIQYAKRIQNAALPPKELLSTLFEHFIFFKPRDIVSGDFYWYKLVNISNKKYHIVVVADCTGHGVPGGFVSMLGISFLNEIVVGIKNLSANEILNELREKVKMSLHQTGKSNEQKDGMDIALCIIDEENMKMEYSGAHNPVYLIKVKDKQSEAKIHNKVADIKIHKCKGVKNKENEYKPEITGSILEIKADRMPIGINKIENSFTKKEIKLDKGDTFYIFTDGFADQFGGERATKFKYNKFRDLLYSIHKKPMEIQNNILEEAFNDWKGDIEQIDDVLIIGVKIK